MNIFPTYFAKRNLQSHFLHKYLKAMANKTFDIMRNEEFHLEK